MNKKLLISHITPKGLKVGNYIDITFLNPEEPYKETPWEMVTTIGRKSTGIFIITTTERAIELQGDDFIKIKY